MNCRFIELGIDVSILVITKAGGVTYAPPSALKITEQTDVGVHGRIQEWFGPTFRTNQFGDVIRDIALRLEVNDAKIMRFGGRVSRCTETGEASRCLLRIQQSKELTSRRTRSHGMIGNRTDELTTRHEALQYRSA